MDDRDYFELEDEVVSDDQLAFLTALRARLAGRLRPYSVGVDNGRLQLCLDVDAPEVALVTVGLDLGSGDLRGDRISIHDRTFPETPTRNGFHIHGSPAELADRAAELLEFYANRPVVRHEWLHRGRVYADCLLFEDTGERLSQMYRSDWALGGRRPG